MRIIDADALKKLLMLNNKTTQDVIYAVIDSVPTVDAVPVVRCGECKNHGNCDIEDTLKAICHKSSSEVFCSEGERKDGEK